MNKQQEQQIQEITNALQTLRDDESVPKNVRSKIDEIIKELHQEGDLSAQVSKSLHVLDEIAEDLNLQAFIRPQIWNISSMFEKLNN